MNYLPRKKNIIVIYHQRHESIAKRHLSRYVVSFNYIHLCNVKCCSLKCYYQLLLLKT